MSGGGGNVAAARELPGAAAFDTQLVRRLEVSKTRMEKDDRDTKEQQRDDDVPSGLKSFFGGTWKETAKYYEAAASLVAGLLGFGFLGWIADSLLGTGPKLMLGGFLVGGVFGFYWLGRAMFSKR